MQNNLRYCDVKELNKKTSDLMKCNFESLAVHLDEHIQSSPTVRHNVIFTFLRLFTRTLRCK